MNEQEPILSIETSGTECGTCIYFSDDKFFTSRVKLKNAHSEKIFQAVDYLFKASGINPSELFAIAVSEGPGSFTGLRIGMAAAKGIAHGACLPIIPVPTFDAFAYQLSFFLNNDDKFIIANKVNRQEVYFAKFQIKGNKFIFADKLKILKNEEFIRKAESIRVFGNAAQILNSSINNYSLTDAPSPVFIARWAKEYGTNKKTFNYDFIEPNYLKSFFVKEKKND